MKRLYTIIAALVLAATSMFAASTNVRHLQPPRVAVVMAQYKDMAFNTASTAASFNEFFNGANYDFEEATGSVQQYFKDQSFGQYVPTFDVIGPVTLSHKRAYYGENDEYGNDLRADEMVAEACNLAEDLADFTKYDSDGDGIIDAVIVLFAGVGEVYGVSDDEAIWPYTGDMEISDYEYSVVLDGKTVSYFCAVQELETGKFRAGIGNVVHEFAHILGLPNLCVTDGGLQKTLGDWDVMDHGSYNNRSRTPAAFSAYERFYLGWLEPILLSEPMNVRLRDLSASGDCGMITASGQSNLNGISPDPREFYIVENRQQKGWDKYIPGHGMMLTKVDFVKNKWESDEVNNVERHPCVDIIEADGSAPKYKAKDQTNGFFGKQGDLFPTGATEFKMFSNKMFFSGVKEQGGVITFDFLGGVEKCEVTFYAGGNGTCATPSLVESSKGAGVTLPAVTPKTGYTFLGWATRKSSMTPDAGKAGEKFYPMSDCTLFALYRNETRVDVTYSLKGVEWNSGATYYANRNKAFDISFKAKAGYLKPSPETCQVRIMRGANLMPNYAFEGDSVIVRFAADEVTDNIFITVVNVREQTETGCAAYSHTFTSKCYEGTLQDFSGYDWDVTIANATTLDYDKNKGATFGSGTYPAGSVRLFTEETMGCGVKKVTVTAAANGDGVLQVFLAGNQIGETIELETTSQTYTFEVAEAQSGALDIRLTNTQKAMFLKQITVDFEFLKETEIPDDDPDDPDDPDDDPDDPDPDPDEAINNISIDGNTVVYDIQGRRVMPDQPGFYIVTDGQNTHKTLVR